MQLRSIHNNPYAGKLPRIPAIFKGYAYRENGSGSKYLDIDGISIRVSHHSGPAHLNNDFEVGPHVGRTFEDIIEDLVIASAKMSDYLENYSDVTERDRLAWIRWWVGRERKRLNN